MIKNKEIIQKRAKEKLEKINSWRTLEFNIDENYEYIPKGKLFRLASNILYFGIAFPVLKVLTKVIYDLKIEGKENVKSLKMGAVTISNHVLILDCAMVGLACGSKKVHFTALEDSFKIPFVRKLIKLLNAIPIPADRENRKGFIKALDTLLQDKKLVHFYPEASLCPYCEEIREFKRGAFDFSIKNNVPILPMVFTFRKPKGIRKFFKRKLDVTLNILKPIYPKENIKIEEFREMLYNNMSKIVEKEKQ